MRNLNELYQEIKTALNVDIKLKCSKDEYVEARFIFCHLAINLFPNKTEKEIGQFLEANQSMVLFYLRRFNESIETNGRFRLKWKQFLPLMDGREKAKLVDDIYAQCLEMPSGDLHNILSFIQNRRHEFPAHKKAS